MGSYLLKTISPEGEGLYPAPWKSRGPLNMSVTIAAMLLQISRPLKPWDMQNIYAII